MNELRDVGCVEVQDDKMRRVEDEEGRGSLGLPCCSRAAVRESVSACYRRGEKSRTYLDTQLLARRAQPSLTSPARSPSTGAQSPSACPWRAERSSTYARDAARERRKSQGLAVELNESERARERAHLLTETGVEGALFRVAQAGELEPRVRVVALLELVHDLDAGCVGESGGEEEEEEREISDGGTGGSETRTHRFAGGLPMEGASCPVVLLQWTRR